MNPSPLSKFRQGMAVCLAPPLLAFPASQVLLTTHVHGQNAPGDEFSVLPDTEVPCLYPHHVVKHELQVQPALHTHLGIGSSKLCSFPTYTKMCLLQFSPQLPLRIPLLPVQISGCITVVACPLPIYLSYLAFTHSHILTHT